MVSEATPVKATEAEWHRRIKEARGKGNYLLAYDLSVQALEVWPDSIGFEYQAILALARASATNGARERYDKLKASERLKIMPLDTTKDRQLAVDVASIDGRLWKDFAKRSSKRDAGRYLLRSAQAYASASERFEDFFPAINAATMYLAVGDKAKAVAFADKALTLARKQDPPDYWSAVTRAEALLILGNPAAASEALKDAAACGVGKLDQLATTRQQLAWVLDLVKAPVDTLRNLPMPRVLNWISRPNSSIPAFKAEFTSDQRVIAFGPLLSATDIVMAYALLAAGAEVNLTLPCEPDLILSSPLFTGKPELISKFESVLGQAASKTLVTKEGGPFEPAARTLCRQQARGLARLRSEALAVTPELCSAEDTGVSFGIMPADNSDLTEAAPITNIPPQMTRQPHAILFGDVHGFSQLTESQQLEFLTHIIGGFADALDGCSIVEYAETAGDGLFIVMPDVISAVECGFALHEVLRPERVAAAGLPSHLGLRLSAHVGPLYKRFDPVIRREKFCGMEVIRTARIEPVTPVGETFVTEQFAASLACTASDRYVCEYVGIQKMAKGFGECRMYSLRRAKN